MAAYNPIQIVGILFVLIGIFFVYPQNPSEGFIIALIGAFVTIFAKPGRGVGR